MRASPRDIGRIDQEKESFVLIYQVGGLVIVVHVPYSHVCTGQLFKRRSKNFLFPARKAPLRRGQVTFDHLNGDRTDALRPGQFESGERSPGETTGWD